MVHLADGAALEADLVVVGIGVVPEPSSGWRARALTIDNGVVCDETLFAADGVVAAGDVARWTHRSLGRAAPGRALDQRRRGRGGGRPQPDGRIGRGRSPTIRSPSSGPTSTRPRSRCIGLPGPDDEVVVVDGSVEEGKLVALYRRGDRLRAALAFSRARQLMAYRSAAGRRCLVRRGTGRWRVGS